MEPPPTLKTYVIDGGQVVIFAECGCRAVVNNFIPCEQHEPAINTKETGEKFLYRRLRFQRRLKEHRSNMKMVHFCPLSTRFTTAIPLPNHHHQAGENVTQQIVAGHATLVESAPRLLGIAPLLSAFAACPERMNPRKRVLGIIAGILVARHLKNPEDLSNSRTTPRTESLVASAVLWADRIMRRIDTLYAVK